ncbi:MAG: hypothetical protein AB8B85_20555 [Paracoccaceae bacterium]
MTACLHQLVRYWLGILILGLLSTLVFSPAWAGLQKWDLVFLDASGQPTSAGRAATTEAQSSNPLGFTVAIGCHADGGHALSLQWPEGNDGPVAGPAIDPSLRISKPGTDFYRGPVGVMEFDGTRYLGAMPEAAVSPLRERMRDGMLTITEFSTRNTISLKTAGLERALGEIDCR